MRAYLNAEFRDQLVAGDILVAHSWATTAQQAIDAAPQLAFAYPTEGFPLYGDNAVVLRESGRAELAHAFINYLLRAPVAAAIVQTSRTATANAAAQALLARSVAAQYYAVSRGRDAGARAVDRHHAVRHAAVAGPHVDGDQVGVRSVYCSMRIFS